MTIREWWGAKVRAGEQKSARLAAAARERGVASAHGLRGLPDDELIAQSPARSSLSYAHHEMEMQRRLKDAIVDLTTETTKARWVLGLMCSLTLLVQQVRETTFAHVRFFNISVDTARLCSTLLGYKEIIAVVGSTCPVDRDHISTLTPVLLA